MSCISRHSFHFFLSVHKGARGTQTVLYFSKKKKFFYFFVFRLINGRKKERVAAEKRSGACGGGCRITPKTGKRNPCRRCLTIGKDTKREYEKIWLFLSATVIVTFQSGWIRFIRFLQYHRRCSERYMQGYRYPMSDLFRCFPILSSSRDR